MKVNTVTVVCIVALLFMAFNFFLHQGSFHDANSKEKEKVSTNGGKSSSKGKIKTVGEPPSSSSAIGIKSPLNIPQAIALPPLDTKLARHFLIIVVYLDSNDSVEFSNYVASLRVLKSLFSPYNLIFIGYSNDNSKLTTSRSSQDNDIFITSSKKCEHQKSKSPLINCLLNSTFKYVDSLFKSNSMDPKEMTTMYMVASDFNLNRYFTPNFANSFTYLMKKYGDSFVAVSSELQSSDRDINLKIGSIADLASSKLKLSTLRDLENNINIHNVSIMNKYASRNAGMAIVLVFSQKTYTLSSKLIPNYVLDRSHIWAHRLLDYYALKLGSGSRSGLSTSTPPAAAEQISIIIDITNSAFYLGVGTKPDSKYKTSLAYEHNSKLTKTFYGVKDAPLLDKLSQNQLLGCPRNCRITTSLAATSTSSNIAIRSTKLGGNVYEKLIESATKRHGELKSLTLLAITESNLKSSFNWICWARSAGFSQYLFITDSKVVEESLLDIGEHVHYFARVNSTTEDRGEDAVVSRISNLLGEVHLLLLSKGFNVLTMSAFLLLMNDITVKLFSDSCDVTLLVEAPEALSFIKPSPMGEKILKHLIGYRNNFPSPLSKEERRGILNYDLYKNIFNIKKLHSLEFNVCKFSKGNVVNSDYYFRFPNKRFGNPPLAFNLNVPDTKFLNIWNTEKKSCDYPAVIESVPPNDRENWSFRLRILTSYRSKSFQRLLTSLLSAHYDQPQALKPIPVDIVVDFPNITLAENDYQQILQNYEDTVKIALGFKWPYGPVNVSIHTYCHGIVYAWVNSRLGPHEVLMVLEDDIEVSPYYYKYLIASVNKYYVDPANYNPRTLGISFQRQYHVVGETIFSYYEPYGPKIIEKAIKKHVYYRYQLISSWGPVFFPHPWNSFVDWVNESIRTKSLVQCVPYLFSNNWALRGNVWTPFASRFIFEKGLYIIYHHSPDGYAFITNHKEPGLHFNKVSKKEGVIPLVNSELQLNKMIDAMVTLKSMPIYDFHFRQVSNENSLQLRNIFIDHGLNSCVTVKRTGKKPRSSSKEGKIENKGASFRHYRGRSLSNSSSLYIDNNVLL